MNIDLELYNPPFLSPLSDQNGIYSMPIRPEVVRAMAKALEEQGDDFGAWVDAGEMTEAEAEWLTENYFVAY